MKLIAPKFAFAPDAPRRWATWALLTPVLAIAFTLVGVIGAALAISLVMPSLGEFDPAQPRSILVVLLIPFIGAAALTFAYTAFVERRSFASIGLGGPHPLARFIFGLVLGVVFVFAVCAGIVAFGGAVIIDWAPSFAQPVMLAWTAALLAGFIIQGSTEEIVFRGWMMSAIGPRWGLAFAVILNSAVFGLLHAANLPEINWLAIANVGVFGVYMSLMALDDKNIWRACGWHAGWNWALMTGFEIEVSGLPPAVDALIVDIDRAGASVISGGAFGPEGSIVTTAALIAGSAYHAFRLRARGEGLVQSA